MIPDLRHRRSVEDPAIHHHVHESARMHCGYLKSRVIRNARGIEYNEVGKGSQAQASTAGETQTVSSAHAWRDP